MKTGSHWPEYAAESALLALFMISASFFTTALEHYRSPFRLWLPDPVARRALMGAAMGATAALLIYSPLGARSGAHMNPSVTVAYVRLGRVGPRDGLFYIAAQFAGGLGGMLVARMLLGRRLDEPAVQYVTTRPGEAGLLAAAAGEFLISFVMMSVVLHITAHPKTARWAGVAAGMLVMLTITLEAPLSGMSMNPARTLGPALLAGRFDSIWIYFLVPPLAMLAAAELFRRGRARAVPCAKLNHSPAVRCIFCGYQPGVAGAAAETPSRHDAEDVCITT